MQVLAEWHEMTPGQVAAEWAGLLAWVAWLRGRYELTVEERLPRCWALHPGLIEELSACAPGARKSGHPSSPAPGRPPCTGTPSSGGSSRPPPPFTQQDAAPGTAAPPGPPGQRAACRGSGAAPAR